MKSILVIGLGRFGRHVIRKLLDLGHEVMAVDSQEERVNQVSSLVTNCQIGDSTREEFLSSLGIGNFDACIVAIGDSFQNSLETASLLKEMGGKYVIARAATDIQEKFLLRNGADEVVYPEKQLASWTAIRCASDHVLDYIELGEDCSFFELSVPEEWHGKTILQLDIRRKYGINILGVREKDKLNMNVSADTVMDREKSVLVLGDEKSIHKCFRI